MKCKSFLLVLLLMIPGCTEPSIEDDRTILATTTSMRDSGLLDILLPAFSESTGVEIDFVAVGTGAALNLGKSGDADVLIVHSPEREQTFIEEGHGISRHTFAWNRFVILSPSNDPVGMNDDIIESLTKIAESETCFVSRGDDSGTHTKELELWNLTGIIPEGDWYLSIGQGMSAAITMADEKDCYTISDIGTHLNRDDTDLIHHEFEHNSTLNPYSIVLIEGEHFDETKQLKDFLFGEGKSIIENYTINGQTVFNTTQPVH